MGTARATTAGAALAVALLCSGAAAADNNVGTAGSYTYVEDSTAPVAAPGTVAGDAACPAGTHAVGGGVTNITSPATDLHVSSFFPFDGPDSNRAPDDGWKGSAANRSGVAKALTLTAICAHHRVTYVTRTRTARPSRAAAGTANCPRGTRVLGGGARLGGPVAELWLNSSNPVDGADADSKPDDGWHARAYNNSGLAERVKVYATCADVRIRYIVPPAVTDPGYVFIACPGTTVGTGGGLSISGAAANGWINAIDPYADPDNPPDDGFVGYAATLSGPPQSATFYAQCAR